MSPSLPDRIVSSILSSPGAQVLHTGGNCTIILLPTDATVFAISGEEPAAIPSISDTTYRITAFPRFGRTSPEQIFYESPYTVPAFTCQAVDGVDHMLGLLNAYAMPLPQRLAAIRSCGSYQTEYFCVHGAYPSNAISFHFEGDAIHDPYRSESGMNAIADPTAYYGQAFLSSDFFH